MKRFILLSAALLLVAMGVGSFFILKSSTSTVASTTASKHTSTNESPDARMADADAQQTVNGMTAPTVPTASPALAATTELTEPVKNEGDAPASTQRPVDASKITNADEAVAFFASAKTPAELLEMADMSNPVVREFVAARISEMEETRYESVLEKAARLGSPERLEGPGNQVSILYAFRGEEPLYRITQNLNAAISSGASLIRQTLPYNLDGSGVKVAVWDAGSIRNTHREFNTTRVVKKNPSVRVDDHATHVAGTIGASGTNPSAKGMAPQAAIDSYDWTRDYAEMAAAGAATAADATRVSLSNHSYGYDSTSSDMGCYENECVTTDNLTNSLPFHLVFWAAGNERETLSSKGGFQSVTFNALAKNILTVGAVDDAVTGSIRDISKAAMSSFSNWGPASDGRIKPDLVANGVGIFSSISTGDAAYDTYDGTSMATPSAVGSAALVQQLYAREFSNQRLRSSMLKALLIHTADDLGTAGPDYKNGWGLLNTKKAADLILAHKANLSSPKMIEGVLSNSTRTANHTIQWDGTSPIRATLCWTEPAGTAQSLASSRTPSLRNNLNLRITAPDRSTAHLPFTMPFVGNWTTASMSLPATRGVNNVDTVEQVLIPSPSRAGLYTISVTFNGTLTTAPQTYSLVLTGGNSSATNPPPTVTLDPPADGTSFLPGKPVDLTASASDQSLGGAAGVIQSVEFRSGNSSIGRDTSAPYSIRWTPSTAGTYLLTAVATDTQGATTISAGVTAIVLSGNGTPAISQISPLSGSIGDSVTITGTNLSTVTSVLFNGVQAAFTVNPPSTIQAVVPAGAASGRIAVFGDFGIATSLPIFQITQSPVLINQIYGAGGNIGALYNSDYVELFNRGNSTVNLTGWTLQYATASGNKWSATRLSGSIAPGRFHLVKLASRANGATLPASNSFGTTNLSATQGKLALSNTSTVFTGSSPIGQSGLQDLVGYGTANTYEGSGPASAPSTIMAIFRAGKGSTDSGDNRADFIIGTPNPRNSSTVPTPPR